MMSWLICLVLTLACIVVVDILKRQQVSLKVTVTPDIAGCERILAIENMTKYVVVENMTKYGFGPFNTHRVLKNVLQPLQTRALPNNRLQVAFGIDNAFTTANHKDYKKFVRLASRLLTDFNTEWLTAAGHARSFIQAELESAKESVMLVPLIQTLTLRLSLQSVHGIDVSTVDNTKVAFIAEEINRLWISSKKVTSQCWTDQIKMHEALHDIFPEIDCKVPEQNPLNLILPSYETLWRVVLRCFIELVFRKPADTEDVNGHMGNFNEIWRNKLHKFLANPSITNLTDAGDDGVAVLHITKEALRLYPPTRRVYREFHFQAHLNPELVAADLESCQRNYVNELEGSETAGSIFDPALWVKHGDKMDAGFMPFGRRPYLCPAQATFAYRAIAVLVAALSTAVGNKWKLDPNPLKGRNWNRALQTDREAYADLELVKV